MSKAIEARTYEEALAWLRDHGFDVTEAPGTNGRVFLRKYNVSAAIQKTDEDGVEIFAYPGYLIGSETQDIQQFQQSLQIRQIELTFHVPSSRRSQFAVPQGSGLRPALLQELLQVEHLL